MKGTCTYFGLLAKVPLLVLLLASGVGAQVPDGYYVVASFVNGYDYASQGSGGLWIVHPCVPAQPAAITGLGTDFTSFWMSGVVIGASSVQIRPEDGALGVGEVGSWGTSIDLHVVALDGSLPRTRKRPNECSTTHNVREGIHTSCPRLGSRNLLDRVGGSWLPGQRTILTACHPGQAAERLECLGLGWHGPRSHLVACI